MLYDVKQALIGDPSAMRRAIEARVTDYEIYSFYLGHAFRIGVTFLSPFRTESNPSFYIYANKDRSGLRHIDFGDTRYKGTCYDFVCQKHSLTYKESVELIYTDLIEGKFKPYLSYVERIPTEKTTKVPCVIQYELLNKIFEGNTTYWEEYGLTKEWREFFNILEAQTLYVNNELVWSANKVDPIFIYKIFDKIKGYRPLSNDKSKKWISNTNRYDIQGWEQLPELNEETTLIITKSLKDVAVLRTLGYLAIAPPSESVMLPPVAMRLLREKYGIRKFVLLYDRDHGGMTGARKMFIKYRGEYNVSFKFIQKNFPKDIADFRKKFGYKSTARYLLHLLNYGPNAKLADISANAT